MAGRVSLAELEASGFILHSAEAAAIVVDVCRQFEGGAIRGIPSTHVIRLTQDGTVLAEGPITTDQPPIAKAAQLVDDLLPPFDAIPAYRVPGGLRLVIARALGTLDLPPFRSLDEFCTALSRFAADDLVSTASNLYRAWELAKAPRTPTVSDLRRARRATGLSLEDISSICGVDAALLRELEWGYLKNWRNDAVGRSWLSRYARASGLDEQLVRSIVVPMLDEAKPRRVAGEIAEDQEVALVASGPATIAPAARSDSRPARRWWMLWAVASAASIALLAIITMLVWPRPAVQASLEPTAPAFVPASVPAPGPIPSPPPVPAPVTAPAPAAASAPDPVPARTHTAKKPPKAKPRTPAKHAGAPVATPASTPASKPSFFKRELLRIVIK
jgi:hypothetical protein